MVLVKGEREQVLRKFKDMNLKGASRGNIFRNTLHLNTKLILMYYSVLLEISWIVSLTVLMCMSLSIQL